tara:strand:+ start:487 stop:684 length:198 start_codon:yes stop_codon:yes gene_type:complete
MGATPTLATWSVGSFQHGRERGVAVRRSRRCAQCPGAKLPAPDVKVGSAVFNESLNFKLKKPGAH